MTVRLKVPWAGQAIGSLYTGRDEASLLGDGRASYDITPPTLPRAASITVLGWGDSRIQYGHDATTFTNMKLQGIQHWVQVLSNGSIRMPGGQNFGVAGDTTYQALVRAPLIKASTAIAGIILVGTADRTATAPTIGAAETIGNLSAMIDTLLNSGKLAVLIAETPRGDTIYQSKRLPPNDLLQHQQVHQWCLAQNARPNVVVVDPWPTLCDPYSTTGDAIVGMLYDGLHPSQLGAFTIAQAVVSALSSRFPSLPISVSANSDLYDLNLNPRGNLVANGMLSGNAGTHTGSTGTSADGTTTTLPAGFTNALTPQASYLGRTWQKFVIGGTPSVANPTIIFRIDASAANLSPGDIIHGRCVYAVEAGASGIAGVQLVSRILYADASAPTTIDGDYDAGGGLIPAVAHGGILRTPGIVVGAASAVTSPSLRFQILGINGTPASATIYVSNMEWRKQAVGDIT